MTSLVNGSARETAAPTADQQMTLFPYRAAKLSLEPTQLPAVAEGSAIAIPAPRHLVSKRFRIYKLTFAVVTAWLIVACGEGRSGGADSVPEAASRGTTRPSDVAENVPRTTTSPLFQSSVLAFTQAQS